LYIKKHLVRKKSRKNSKLNIAAALRLATPFLAYPPKSNKKAAVSSGKKAFFLQSFFNIRQPLAEA